VSGHAVRLLPFYPAPLVIAAFVIFAVVFLGALAIWPLVTKRGRSWR